MDTPRARSSAGVSRGSTEVEEARELKRGRAEGAGDVEARERMFRRGRGVTEAMREAREMEGGKDEEREDDDDDEVEEEDEKKASVGGGNRAGARAVWMARAS